MYLKHKIPKIKDVLNKGMKNEWNVQLFDMDKEDKELENTKMDYCSEWNCQWLDIIQHYKSRIPILWSKQAVL